MMSAAREIALLLLMAALVGIGATACAAEDPADGPAASEQTEAPAQASGLDAFAGLSGTLDIAGGTAHIPVMEEAAALIMEAYPDIQITVAGGGSGVGAQQVGEGLVDIGNTGRALKDDELALYPDLESFAFAVDGVAAIVHPDNPVTGLTFEQVQAIFAGEITDWADVGGEAGGIHVYSRDEASGTREVFFEQALDEGEILVEANIVASNGAMKTAVAGDSQGIGYMGIGGIDGSVTGLALGGLAPTQENAKDGTYTVTRLLYMNTKGEPAGLVAAFVDFIMGADAVTIIEEAGYIPLL